MGILDRALFRRKLSKDELAMYGIQAFANGGIVSPYNMANGGPTDPSQLLPQTTPEEMSDSGFKSARETLVQAFMKKLNESGFMEELKKAQESGNKEMEATLVNMYKEMYQREVVDPVEKGSASENMGGFAVGGEVVDEEEEEETVFDVGDASIFESERFKSIPQNKREEEQRIAALSTGVSDVVTDSSGSVQKVNPNRTSDKIFENLNTRYAQGKMSKEQYNKLKKEVEDAKRQELAAGRAGNAEIKEFNQQIDDQASKIDQQIAEAEADGNTGLVDALKKEKEKTLKKKKDLVSEKATETTTPKNAKSKGDLNDPSTERENIRTLEEMVKERSDLYKSMLGDPKKQLAMQGYMQLAQFGLNLASAQGSNFAAKVANSAKDPLTAFAALGRQAQQDEDAITLAAIKSSEDERAQTLKPGGFGELVNDLMRNKGVTREVAAAEATEIYAQKSGKTVTEIRNDRFQEYLRFYEAEEGAGEIARGKANDAIRQEFGTPMYKTEDDLKKEETTDTDTAVIKLD